MFLWSEYKNDFLTAFEKNAAYRGIFVPLGFFDKPSSEKRFLFQINLTLSQISLQITSENMKLLK